MRAIGLVLTAVAFSLTIATAEAARRSDQATSGRSATASRATTAAPRPAIAATARMTRPTPAVATQRGRLIRTAYAAPAQSGRSVAASRHGRQAAVAQCSRTSRGRGPQRCAASGGGLSWQAGLSPAAHVQTTDCPEGTMATLATGHTNVVRCMPI